MLYAEHQCDKAGLARPESVKGERPWKRAGGVGRVHITKGLVGSG